MPGDDTEGRILAAVLGCLARYGLGKTTLDDVAREAGCARATVYRYFPGKRALIAAAVGREGARVTHVIEAAGRASPSLEDAVVAMMLAAARELTEHAALQRVLAEEPEVVLPFVTFDAGSRFLTEAGAVFAPTLAAHLPTTRAARAAEWCTRVLLAYLAPPSVRVSMVDEDAVRDLARRYVLPGLGVEPAALEPIVSVPSRG